MITKATGSHHLFTRVISLAIIGTFLVSSLAPPSGFAQITPQTVLNLPVPGTMLSSSIGFTPASIKGVNIHPDHPLQFDFIIDRGSTEFNDQEFRIESDKLIKYFLAALTVPQEQMWVNLSPYESNRIIPQSFGQTTMGRDLLAQDYLLKQLSASLMHPDQEVGKKYWEKIKNHATDEQRFTPNDSRDFFNKIWIVPDQALVYEHSNGAYVVDSHLKVMVEEDYLAMTHNGQRLTDGSGQITVDRGQITEKGGQKTVDSEQKTDNGRQKVGENVLTSDISFLSSESSRLSTQTIRETLVPAIEREVNEGETFANLRQIYNAVILVTWYKQALKDSLIGQVYVDQQKTTIGINVEDQTINQKIYDQYVEAFKTGVYDFIKEEYDSTAQQIIPKKYFSGGANFDRAQLVTNVIGEGNLGADWALLSNLPLGDQKIWDQIRESQSVGRSHQVTVRLAVELPNEEFLTPEEQAAFMDGDESASGQDLAMVSQEFDADAFATLTVGKRVKMLRKNLRFSIPKLAELVGVDRSTVRLWENDQIQMKPDNLRKLANVLNVDVMMIYQGKSMTQALKDAKDMGSRIKLLRINKGLTPQGFALAIKVERSTVKAWERISSVSPPNIIAIANFFEVEALQIYAGITKREALRKSSSIGQRLEFLRVDRGLSRNALKKQLGVISNRFIPRWELTGKIAEEWKERLARFFDVTQELRLKENLNSDDQSEISFPLNRDEDSAMLVNNGEADSMRQAVDFLWGKLTSHDLRTSQFNESRESVVYWNNDHLPMTKVVETPFVGTAWLMVPYKGKLHDLKKPSVFILDEILRSIRQTSLELRPVLVMAERSDGLEFGIGILETDQPTEELKSKVLKEVRDGLEQRRKVAQQTLKDNVVQIELNSPRGLNDFADFAGQGAVVEGDAIDSSMVSSEDRSRLTLEVVALDSAGRWDVTQRLMEETSGKYSDLKGFNDAVVKTLLALDDLTQKVYYLKNIERLMVQKDDKGNFEFLLDDQPYIQMSYGRGHVNGELTPLVFGAGKLTGFDSRTAATLMTNAVNEKYRKRHSFARAVFEAILSLPDKNAMGYYLRAVHRLQYESNGNGYLSLAFDSSGYLKMKELQRDFDRAMLVNSHRAVNHDQYAGVLAPNLESWMRQVPSLLQLEQWLDRLVTTLELDMSPDSILASDEMDDVSDRWELPESLNDQNHPFLLKIERLRNRLRAEQFPQVDLIDEFFEGIEIPEEFRERVEWIVRLSTFIESVESLHSEVQLELRDPVFSRNITAFQRIAQDVQLQVIRELIELPGFNRLPSITGRDQARRGDYYLIVSNDGSEEPFELSFEALPDDFGDFELFNSDGTQKAKVVLIARVADQAMAADRGTLERALDKVITYWKDPKNELVKVFQLNDFLEIIRTVWPLESPEFGDRIREFTKALNDKIQSPFFTGRIGDFLHVMRFYRNDQAKEFNFIKVDAIESMVRILYDNQILEDMLTVAEKQQLTEARNQWGEGGTLVNKNSFDRFTIVALDRDDKKKSFRIKIRSDETGNISELSFAEAVVQYDYISSEIKGEFAKLWEALRSGDISSDEAMIGEQEEFIKGGIDLNPAFNTMNVQRDGGAFEMPLLDSSLKNLDIQGFIPVIIQVTPIVNLPLLLGFVDKAAPPDPNANNQRLPVDHRFEVGVVN